MPNYVFNQGKVYLSPIDPTTKEPTNQFYWVGNIATDGLTLTLNTDNFTHQESFTGDRLTDLSIELGKTLQGVMTFEEWSLDNLMTVLYGKGSVASGTTVTDEPHTAQSGYNLFLNNINLSVLTTITGTGGSPTYVEGTDYRVDLRSGGIEILASGGIADDTPIEATYTFGNHDNVTAFSKNNQDYWFRFDGLNSAQNNEPVIVDVFRTRIMPPNEMSLISNAIAPLQCNFSGLYVRELDLVDGDKEGGFMRIRKTSL